MSISINGADYGESGREFSHVPQVEEKGEALLEYDEHGHLKNNSPPQASVFSSVMNLANTILGAGMLGLPHAFAESGYVFGCILLLLFALLSAFGLHLLSVISIQLCSETRDANFYKVASAAMSSGALLIDVAVAIKCFGVGISYLIVCGDLLPQALQFMGASGILTNRRFLITILHVTIVTPLCCLKNLDALRFTSTLSICFVLFITCVIFAYAVDPSLDVQPEHKGSQALFVFEYGTLKILTIFIFGYTCHQNIFSIVNEIKDLNQKNLNKVIASSVGSGFVVYLIIALSGYATFGSKVAEDILQLYDQNTLITVCRIFVALLVTLSFPLQCFPCRYSCQQIVATTCGPARSERETRIRWYAITFVICVGSWAVAMVLDSLGLVLAVVGATGSTTISYILPGYVYYSLKKEW
eukprot:CAMPEP_0197517364 /NCGR_PEP_ID=MMETSP1318-20131121/2342_1 /TAXON_ID=552666 /ORGANISM="Partenskyella glossopodia, Strain RCC365" /LENGTH=413 /DNA_ID=CAMNT_0043066837 /DNA_START=221 /DNA_END=1459 /DNA_ORIENTATION=+